MNDLTKNIDDHNRSSVESTDRLDKKIKRIKEAPEFKHKYNKVQYDLNHNIIESLEDISDLLSKNKADAAEKKLEEAIVKLKKRNKLIKLADKSQAGWYFAEEYETDNLASEDEKKIKRAKRSAMAKRKIRPSTSTVTRLPSTQSSPYHLFRPQRSSTEAFIHQSSTIGVTHGKDKQGDRCFGCGKFGHWRRECRAQQNSHVNPQFVQPTFMPSFQNQQLNTTPTKQ